MYRRGRTCQVIDLIHLEHYGLDDVMPDELKLWISQLMLNVCLAPCEKVVKANDLTVFFNEISQRWDPRKPAPPVTRTLFDWCCSLIILIFALPAGCRQRASYTFAHIFSRRPSPFHQPYFAQRKPWRIVVLKPL